MTRDSSKQNDLPIDIVSIVESEYARLLLKSEVLDLDLNSHHENAPPLGFDVYQEGRSIGIVAGTTYDTHRDKHGPALKTHHGLTVNQARQLRDGLETAIQNVEAMDSKSVEADDASEEPEPKTLAERLVEVVR